MMGRRSLVTMRPGDSAAAEQAASDAAQAAAAAMTRANNAMSVANGARATANNAATAATDADAKAADLKALADSFQSALASSVSDRAQLHTDLQALLSAVAGKASIEALSSTNSALGNLGGQVSTLAASLAGKASQSALDTLSTLVSGKASQAALNGIADAVGLLQTGLSTLAAKVAALELRPTVTIRQGSTPLPALLLLGTTDVKVTWPSPLPSASYFVVRDLADDGGDQFRAKVKSQTAADCTITIRALVGLSAGAKLDVVAIHTT